MTSERPANLPTWIAVTRLLTHNRSETSQLSYPNAFGNEETVQRNISRVAQPHVSDTAVPRMEYPDACSTGLVSNVPLLNLPKQASVRLEACRASASTSLLRDPVHSLANDLAVALSLASGQSLSLFRRFQAKQASCADVADYKSTVICFSIPDSFRLHLLAFLFVLVWILCRNIYTLGAAVASGTSLISPVTVAGCLSACCPN